MTTIAVRTGNLEVAGATIHHELRGRGPLLVLHAAPMTTDAFAGAADLLAADHTVLTSDPRGVGGSTVDDRNCDVSPELRADDLIRLLEYVDAGPAVLFGSSGGAVSALALAVTRPDLVSTVIAHEPPLAELLPDRDRILAATDRMIETYLTGDRLRYWNQFLDVAGIVMPPEVVEHVFGGPLDERGAADERYAVVHMNRCTTFWKPDLRALRTVADRLVIGIGEDSAGQLCDRASRALGAHLGVEPTLFPGDHTGFAEDPAAFVARLSAVLDARKQPR